MNTWEILGLLSFGFIVGLIVAACWDAGVIRYWRHRAQVAEQMLRVISMHDRLCEWGQGEEDPRFGPADARQTRGLCGNLGHPRECLCHINAKQTG